MSKLRARFLALFIAVSGVLCCVSDVNAEDISIHLKVLPNSTIVKVEGKVMNRNQLKYTRNFPFELLEKHTERIRDFLAFDQNDQLIKVKALKPGEYLAEADATKFEYLVDLKTSPNYSDKAHHSWLEENGGILMFRDLLPQFETINGEKFSARIRLDLPIGWDAMTAETRSTGDLVDIVNLDSAVITVGSRWRSRNIKYGGVNINLAISGEFRFSDKDASEMIGEILFQLKQTFGEYPKPAIQITLVHAEKLDGRWNAETRGNSVTIISGDMAFEKPSLQRLNEQLRHELLHLWIPNGLALTGNYDWFFEGFSIYQSLKIGVAMNRLSFEDFLGTLTEAYRLSNLETEQISLLSASRARNSGSNQQVYAKGMLVAFLCDAAVLSRSRGKRSVSEILQQVYKTHRLPNEPQDGNISILNILTEYSELRLITEDYIKGTKKLNWDDSLKQLGIEQNAAGEFIQLKVRDKLTGRQKDLLDKLGYNNWRNIGKNSK